MAIWHKREYSFGAALEGYLFLQICWKEKKLKLIKRYGISSVHVSLLWQNHFQIWCETRSLCALWINRDAGPKNKDLHLFLDIMNYLWKLFPNTAEVCKPLCDWHWQEQNGHGTNHTKIYMTEHMCLSKGMYGKKVYNVRKPLYLETDASHICLGVGDCYR